MLQIEFQELSNDDVKIYATVLCWYNFKNILITTSQQLLTSRSNFAHVDFYLNRKLIQEINWQRKNMQTQGGEKLRQLEAQWVGLVSKNYEIEQACVQLEKEVARLKLADKK